MKLRELAQDLINEVAAIAAEVVQAKEKNAQLHQELKSMRLRLGRMQKVVDKKDTRITELRASVAYHRANTTRYQQDLAEARSLLRKTRH